MSKKSKSKNKKVKIVNGVGSRNNVHITKLPCTIGDKVYFVNWSTFDEEEDKPIVEIAIVNGWKVERFTISERISQMEDDTGCKMTDKEKDDLLKKENKYEDILSLILDNGEEIEYNDTTFGTDLFFTEKEAEDFIMECGY